MEGSPKSEFEEARTAVRLIVNLYAGVLALPDRGLGEDVEESGVSDDIWRKMLTRFEGLSFNYYSKFFSPEKGAAEEPVTGNLADDLADTYRDIKKGLNLYERGYAADAVWQWNQSFETHWGRHATSAMHALHAYLADEDIER